MAAPARITVGHTVGLAFALDGGLQPPAGEYVDAQSYDELRRLASNLAHSGLEIDGELLREHLAESKTSPAPAAHANQAEVLRPPSGAGGDQPPDYRPRRAAYDESGELLHLPAVLGDAFGVSRSEARRCLTQGGVAVDGAAVSALDQSADDLHGRTLTLGKRRAIRLVTSPAPAAGTAATLESGGVGAGEDRGSGKPVAGTGGDRAEHVAPSPGTAGAGSNESAPAGEGPGHG